MTRALRVGGTATINQTFANMTTDAAAKLEELSSGLSSSMTVVNHFVPGSTSLTADPAATGNGYLVSFQWMIDDGTIATVVDADGTYGHALDFFLPAGIYLPIDHIVKGNPTEIHLSAGYDANDLTSNYHWGKRKLGLKNVDGTNTGGFFDGLLMSDGAEPTIISSSQVNLAVDSTSWTISPSAGEALLAFKGGTGTASIGEVPDSSRPSCYGDVEYFYSRLKVNAAYKNNDGAGGQKTVGGNWSNIDPWGQVQSIGFLQCPSWQYGTGNTGPGDDSGPIGLGANQYNLDRYNGTDLGDEQPKLFGLLGSGLVTRGTYVTCELIIQQPATRGEDASYWVYLDGVLAMTWTDRVVQFTDGSAAYAWRAVQQQVENVWGGGGCVPDVDIHNYYDELMHMRGWSIAGAGSGIALHGTCEQGDTPPSGSPFYVDFEIRDGNGVRLDVGNSFNCVFGRQQVELTTTSGTVSLVAAAGALAPFVGFTFSSTTSTPPSAGEVRVNNATIGSVTHVYISNTDGGSGTEVEANAANLIPGLDLRIAAALAYSATSYAEFTIVSATEVGSGPTGYWDVEVTAPTNTLPADGTLCVVAWSVPNAPSGKIRAKVTGASAGSVTVAASIKEVASNDKFTGNHFDGSKTVTVT